VADRFGAVVEYIQVDRSRHLDKEGRQEFPDRLHHLHRIGSRLTLDGQNNGAGAAGLVIIPARHFVVFHTVDDLSQILETHRRTIAIGHNERTVGGGFSKLAGCLNGKGLVLAIKGSRGEVDVGTGDGVADVVEPDSHGSQGLGIDLHPHGVFLRPIDLYLGDPVHHGDALRHEGVGIFVNHRQRQDG